MVPTPAGPFLLLVIVILLYLTVRLITFAIGRWGAVLVDSIPSVIWIILIVVFLLLFLFMKSQSLTAQFEWFWQRNPH